MTKISFASHSIALAICLGVTASASAQEVTSITVASDPSALPDFTDETIELNIEECLEFVDSNPVLSVDWDLSDDTPSGDPWRVTILRPGGNCDATTLTDCEILESGSSSVGSASVDFSMSTLFGDREASTFCAGGTSLTYTIEFDFLQDDGTNGTGGSLELKFLLQRPAAPTDVTTQPGESAIDVAWENTATSIDDFRIFYADAAFPTSSPEDLLSDADVRSELVTPIGDLNGRITDGITVGATYYIAVSAVDDDGNHSIPTEPIEVVAQPATDFFEDYRNAGGVEEGGCTVSNATSGTTAPAWWLLSIALVGLGRRRK